MASALKLSPSLKALIKLPTARGAPTPSPGRSVLKGVFDRVKARGEAGESAATHEVNDRVQAAAVMRESGLKSISFTGIPKVINNLNALRDYLGEDVKAGLSTLPLRQPRDIAALYERGMGLWDGIYEPHSKKLVDKLGDSHPDLPVHILNSHYGPLLSDPEGPVPDGAFLLGRVLTSVIAIAGLRAQTGVGPQVTSHVFGLKKALLEGGGGDGKVLQGQEWLTSDEGVTWVIESVDEIGAVMRGDK